MKFSQPNARIFVPDGTDPQAALERTTHLAIGAHQDDLEIMAIDGILTCFSNQEKWFTGVTVTNGGGSPRSGIYGKYSEEEMAGLRDAEQEKAAVIGEYGAQLFLDYSSSTIKDPSNKSAISDFEAILKIAQPEIVYVHNLADKHPTHIGTTVKTIQAIRSLPEELRPQKLYGCEVWRALDWLMDDEKVIFDTSALQNIQQALISVFDSQISGGKRYDLATMGRRQTNATYFASHNTDQVSASVYGMDLTPLIQDTTLDIGTFVVEHISRFADDVSSLIKAVC